jgi:DNA-binding GntR family transcriptional regulator
MKPISSITKVDQVRHAILELIFNGSLTPGQRLVEANLARDFGVSQATVNSALQDLHNQGVVTKILNRSSNVNRFTAAEINKLFAVRTVLEPMAAAEASRQITREGVRGLEEQVDAMRRAARSGDLSRFCLADYTFHQNVYRLTRNSFLIQACQAIAAAPFAYLLCDCLGALPTDYVSLAEDHSHVVRALEKGPEAAAEVTRERVERWRSHSLRALEVLEERRLQHAVA